MGGGGGCDKEYLAGVSMLCLTPGLSISYLQPAYFDRGKLRIKVVMLQPKSHE